MHKRPVRAVLPAEGIVADEVRESPSQQFQGRPWPGLGVARSVPPRLAGAQAVGGVIVDDGVVMRRADHPRRRYRYM